MHGNEAFNALLRELDRDALAYLVRNIWMELYLDRDGSGRTYLNPDRPVSGADFLDYVLDRFRSLGLHPPTPTESP